MNRIYDTGSPRILSWHFLRADRKLGYEDGRLAEEGVTHEVAGDIALCKRGLHASIRAIDALQYAPGSVVARVELSGAIIHGDDKLVASHRKYLRIIDATELLFEFGCWCAEEAIKARRAEGYAIPAACDEAIAVKRRHMRGDVSDKDLSAAWSAAESAAWSAAESAAWSAAESAARSAAESAAWSAAESAAGSAAWSAAESAAWSAAESAARSAAWSAARSAAWSAARSAAGSAAGSAARYAARYAARSAQNAELERRLLAAMEAV